MGIHRKTSECPLFSCSHRRLFERFDKEKGHDGMHFDLTRLGGSASLSVPANAVKAAK